MNTRSISTQQGTIVAIFRDHDQAENAVKELRDAGFSANEIGIAGSHNGRGFFDKLSDFFSAHDETDHSDFAGSLSQLEVPKDQASYVEQAVASGSTLVTVRADGERRTDALRILGQYSAELEPAVNSKSTSAQTSRSEGAVQDEQKIRLLGETLRIHKDRVARGEVRLRKEVVTEQQNVQVPVTREELVIERTPGDSREAATGQSIGSDDEIRVPLTEERVRVEKKAVVNEEIKVGKRQVQGTKQVSDTLRREQVQVEPDGEVTEEEVRELPRKRTA